MKSLARELSLQQLDQRWQQHRDCEAEVRQVGPHWGVYCGDHGRWIQWIRQDQIDQILAENNHK